MTNGYCIDWKRLDINLEGRGTPINTAVALLIAPVIGLAFLMFLPFIGFYLALSALALKTGKLIKGWAEDYSTTLSSPGEAHLTGHKPSENAQEDTTLDELAKEIQSLRKR